MKAKKRTTRIDVKAHDRARVDLPPRDTKGRFKKKKAKKGPKNASQESAFGLPQLRLL